MISLITTRNNEFINEEYQQNQMATCTYLICILLELELVIFEQTVQIDLVIQLLHVSIADRHFILIR
jgi:hypothetical protein